MALQAKRKLKPHSQNEEGAHLIAWTPSKNMIYQSILPGVGQQEVDESRQVIHGDSGAAGTIADSCIGQIDACAIAGEQVVDQGRRRWHWGQVLW